jgi:hypothetical protein
MTCPYAHRKRRYHGTAGPQPPAGSPDDDWGFRGRLVADKTMRPTCLWCVAGVANEGLVR